MTFKLWDSYPEHANKNYLQKNGLYGGVSLLILLFAYFQFIGNSISITSNALRFILFLILFLIGAWYINKSSKEAEITFTNDEIVINGESIIENQLYGFEVVQLEGYLEYVILTTKVYNQYKYFYKKIEDPENPQLTRQLLEVTQYIEGISSKDFLHRILRYLKIK
ncbi:MAG: hypothetical protein ACRCXZ_02255 [Patescibacteria group bacterium]